MTFSELKLSQAERDFTFNFAILEHDLSYFFEKRCLDYAMEHINRFHDRIKDNLYNIRPVLFKESLISLTCDLTSVSFYRYLNMLTFVNLRKDILHYLTTTTLTHDNFLPLLETIVNNYFSNLDTLDIPIDGNRLSKQVALVVYYIDNHCDEPLKTNTILKALTLDPDYTKRQFRKELGFTINFYIRHAKLQRAKQLLINTHLPIGEIAAKIKFYNSAEFARQFQKEFDITPSKYRELNQIFYEKKE
ncbi:AraC family transcriptional regulator [Lactiplantibacillus paraplantarum]|uniref:helix-turn-helix transcriptional regulator n=1 Tax=Lactiplantibacillus paraplantarum TaxID=60520 RepID=UPI000513C939|nr:AraC family transcriptional regulator [Lactiplantibacillus paraplantarum]ALO05317.1 AraC family transcriptional regulator [Lactiplantibacillus paraplantarum]KGE76610.1 AraC family transcriptional regulator [Lactiplantibacillus paraplantarum]MCT4456840.1 AraC family transcriptional regulator [Lactiplantibacillus paraplantarum]MCW1911553.1 AraC family transcriptional regulator [Lactiplantibacillus paraplantarum]RDG11693.1 AraC family transcriptional regulator [Lactiplantibacillus paraplantaru